MKKKNKGKIRESFYYSERGVCNLLKIVSLNREKKFFPLFKFIELWNDH